MAVEFVPRLLEYRAAVCKALKCGVPQLRDVGPHAGNFGAETLKRFISNTPSARVSFIGMRAMKRNNVGQMTGPVSMSVFIAAKDPLVGQAFGPAIEIAERVADFIDFNSFGLPYASVALINEIEPMYSEQIDELGVGIAAISFVQEVTIGRSKHAIDESLNNPDWFDFEQDPGEWPGNLNVGASSNMNIPNLFGENPEPSPDANPHPDEQEQL